MVRLLALVLMIAVLLVSVASAQIFRVPIGPGSSTPIGPRGHGGGGGGGGGGGNPCVTGGLDYSVAGCGLTFYMVGMR